MFIRSPLMVLLLVLALLGSVQCGSGSANNDDSKPLEAVPGVNTTIPVKSQNFTYTPSWYVTALHKMPHINPYGQIESKVTFEGGEASGADSYYKSVIVFPIIMASLLVLTVVVLQLFIFGHLENYLPWKPPGPIPLLPEDETRSGIALWTHKIESSRRFYVIFFLICLGVVLVGSHIMFVGNYYCDIGVDSFDSGLRKVEEIVFNGRKQMNS